MKEVTLQVPDKEYSSFMEVIKKLRYVKTVRVGKQSAKAKLLHDLQGSIEELKEVKAGKKKARTLDDFLNEL